MMIKVTNSYEIAADQIEALARGEEPSGGYRYILKIFTKSGHTYEARYSDYIERENEIKRIKKDISEANKIDKVMDLITEMYTPMTSY